MALEHGFSAVLSHCGLYRYRLARPDAGGLLANGRTTLVVMVNPSTADGLSDDQTMRKVLGFGLIHGFGRTLVGNLFAYRSTNVRDLRTATDPVGPDNDLHLRAMMAEADRIVFAWGPAAKLPTRLRRRWIDIHGMATATGKRPLCLGTALDGHPLHPLTLGYDARLGPWSPPPVPVGAGIAGAP